MKTEESSSSVLLSKDIDSEALAAVLDVYAAVHLWNTFFSFMCSLNESIPLVIES